MPRKNMKAPERTRARAKPKPKKSKTDRPGGKRPKTPADDDIVSRSSRVRSTSRGGRGR